MRQPSGSPREVAANLVNLSQKNKVAVLFGPEDIGLTNDELKHCQYLITIPTSDKLRSLNLSHAVMIVCYELFRCSLEAPKEFTPRLANRFELDAMYAQLKDVLLRICFINPANPDYFMNNLRHFGTRMQLRAKEVQIIRGICRQIDWYGKHCFKEGKKAKDGGG
jgi:tRNA/rRNA methyltransferase